MDLGLNMFRKQMPSGETWRRSLQDPLLVVAVVVLVIALVGIALTMAASIQLLESPGRIVRQASFIMIPLMALLS